MKKWNTPEITALDLNETMSGLFCTEWEVCWVLNDNLKKCDPPQELPKNDPPATPTDEDVTNLTS